MKEICTKSKYYADLAKKVIKATPELHFIRDTGIRIAYLESTKAKTEGGKLVLADCRKVPAVYLPFCACEFIITVYAPNVDALSEDQLKILLLHELLHVGIDDKTQEVTFVINPHEIEEFKLISDRFGFEWSEPGADVPDITADCGK